MECGGGARGNQVSGNGLGIGRRAGGESQGVRASALDDWVFNPDPPARVKCMPELLGKPRSEGTASRSVLRSKLSAKAGWDKLSLVFMTDRHIGQALKLRRQSRESHVPLF